MFDILNRPPMDHQAVKDELFSLISSNISIKIHDLLCFDSKDNVRQCAIGSKPGACQATDQSTGKKKITRSCDNKFSSNPQYITIYDSINFASFDIKCNRSLYNGHLTLQAVKEIMFKYNITKTIEGRLNNHGLRLSLSFTFLISIII